MITHLFQKYVYEWNSASWLWHDSVSCVLRLLKGMYWVLLLQKALSTVWTWYTCNQIQINWKIMLVFECVSAAWYNYGCVCWHFQSKTIGVWLSWLRIILSFSRIVQLPVGSHVRSHKLLCIFFHNIVICSSSEAAYSNYQLRYYFQMCFLQWGSDKHQITKSLTCTRSTANALCERDWITLKQTHMEDKCRSWT